MAKSKAEEIPCAGLKREWSEDASNDSDSEESDFSIDYDSDDPCFEILEGKADPKIWKQYYKEWRQSEGFDITVVPGTFMGGIEPIYDHLTNPKKKQEFTQFCELAIHDFNSKNDDNKIYTFVEIVHVTASYAAGTWYYLTFNARDTTIDAAAADAIKTFQAAVWQGIDESIRVHFCRLEKFVTDEASDQVILGWQYGVVDMRVGDKRRITIPPDLGYGAKGTPDVPPNSWLVIEVELIYVK